MGKLMIEVERVLTEKFNRSSEVEEQSTSVASEASPCPHDGRWSIRRELSFPHSGEWEQKKGYAPLLTLHFQQGGITKFSRWLLYLYIPTPTPTPACDFLVCLYIPESLSLKQRNLVVGFISSIHWESKAFYPLSFEYPIQPPISLPYGLYREMSYHYTKNNIVESLLERKKFKCYG